MLTLLLTNPKQVLWREVGEGGRSEGGRSEDGRSEGGRVYTSKKLSKCSCSSSGDTGNENKTASLLSVI